MINERSLRKRKCMTLNRRHGPFMSSCHHLNMSFVSISFSVHKAIIRFFGSVHLVCPNISRYWMEGPFLSLLHDFGTPSHQTTVSLIINISLKTHLFKLAFPFEFSPIHRTVYPNLILVFPSLFSLWNDTWC